MMQNNYKFTKKYEDFCFGDLKLFFDFQKKIALKKLISINNNYNFIKTSNNDFFNIKVENQFIPKINIKSRKYLRIILRNSKLYQ